MTIAAPLVQRRNSVHTTKHQRGPSPCGSWPLQAMWSIGCDLYLIDTGIATRRQISDLPQNDAPELPVLRVWKAYPCCSLDADLSTFDARRRASF